MSVKYTSYMPKVKKKIDKELVNKMFKAALIIKEATVKKLKGGGSSKEARLVPGTKTAYYYPSVPGEEPAEATGRLFGSIEAKVVEDNIGTSYQVGSPLKKALWLEKGTPKMQPRPFLLPAYKESRNKAKKILSKKIK